MNFLHLVELPYWTAAVGPVATDSAGIGFREIEKQ